MAKVRQSAWLGALAVYQLLLSGASAADTLKLSSFSECLEKPDVSIDQVDIQYNADSANIDFNIAGHSSKSENVTASLSVTAYGKDVYTNTFNPCDTTNYVAQLCPVPTGDFSASGTQVIPSEFKDKIPAIAFSIPDIALEVTIELKTNDDGRDVGCVVADLSNGKSVNSNAVTYVAGGIAVATLLISAITSLVAGSGGGSEPGHNPGMSPNLSEMISWFQGVATSGMLSVNYPPLYRSFTERFAFATGLISWTNMQTSIDKFRARTGGNITTDNIQYLRNATLIFSDPEATNEQHISRALHRTVRLARAISFERNSSDTGGGEGISSDVTLRVSGIQAYVEQSGIVQENTFMTVFLIACLVVSSIVVGVVFSKVVLEIWALCGRFPTSLAGFRQHYWGTTFRVNVILINMFYGTWVLYSISQFKSGDSWAATILAAVTLVLFSGILIFFTVHILRIARRNIRTQGSASPLFQEKKIWIKYSLFYDVYRHKSWWFFIPRIVYNFVRYALLAALDGHGLAQTVSMLVVDSLLLFLYLLVRPFERKIENIVHIFIQVVRVLSMGGILVFVDTLKVQKTTQTIMGFVLIILTATLTIILVLLMVVNAFITCCKENPHRKRRKDAEKRKRESEALIVQNHYDMPFSDPGSMQYAPDSRHLDPAKVPLASTRNF